jgi:hypothetical protein
MNGIFENNMEEEVKEHNERLKSMFKKDVRNPTILV